MNLPIPSTKAAWTWESQQQILAIFDDLENKWNEVKSVNKIESEERKGHIQKLTIGKKSTFWTLCNWLPHEVIIFTKFYEDRAKNIDFFYQWPLF